MGCVRMFSSVDLCLPLLEQLFVGGFVELRHELNSLHLGKALCRGWGLEAFLKRAVTDVRHASLCAERQVLTVVVKMSSHFPRHIQVEAPSWYLRLLGQLDVLRSHCTRPVCVVDDDALAFLKRLLSHLDTLVLGLQCVLVDAHIPCRLEVTLCQG